jgi:coenzyme F420-0:L-glutamate ligase/coenzyme F420-1:gamma-L-glutamate ligase
MTVTQRIAIQALPGIGEITASSDLSLIISDALRRSAAVVDSSSVIVIAQKIVSKSEGRQVFLDEITPSPSAMSLAALTRKDPALVEMILQESTEVVRARANVLIVRHRLGYVVANAGIDQSNVDGGGRPACLLLPQDPTSSAGTIRNGLARRLGISPAVIIADSFGRPWRRGVVSVALASSGLPALLDRRGHLDLHGRALQVTEVALADALAAAAGVVMGEGNEGTPVALITGGDWSAAEVDAQTLVRPLSEDLFR